MSQSVTGIPNIALIDSISQFLNGTQAVWNNITIPIPAGLVVYAIDTTAIKIGDGVTLYSNLPVVFYLNSIVSLSSQIAELTTQIFGPNNTSIAAQISAAITSALSSNGQIISTINNTIMSDLTAPNGVIETSVASQINTSITQDLLSNGVIGQALTSIVSSLTEPPGTIKMWSGTTPPTGWLELNGQSTSSYTALAAICGANVSDFRGYFPRGWDNSRGIDSGRALLSAQTDVVGGHNHTINETPHTHTESSVQTIRAGNSGNYWNALVDGPLAATGGAGTNPGVQSTAGILPASTDITINPNNTSENIVKNIAVMFIIKT